TTPPGSPGWARSTWRRRSPAGGPGSWARNTGHNRPSGDRWRSAATTGVAQERHLPVRYDALSRRAFLRFAGGAISERGRRMSHSHAPASRTLACCGGIILLVTTACGASPRVERAVAARHAAALRSGAAEPAPGVPGAAVGAATAGEAAPTDPQ